MLIHSKLYVDGELKLHVNNGFSKDRSELLSRTERLHYSIHAEMFILSQDKFTGHKVLVQNLCPCFQCAKALSISDINEVHIPCEIPKRWRDKTNSCVDGFNLLVDSNIHVKLLPIDSGDDLHEY